MRAFREADLAAVQALIFETIDRSYGPVYPPRALDFFKAFHSAEEIRKRGAAGTILVVEHDGAVIATGALVEGEILAVFVHPAQQGRGHGKALMRALEAQARAAGHAVSELSVSLPSRRFYESLGYEMLEERRRDLGAGQEMRFWKARKALQSEP